MAMPSSRTVEVNFNEAVCVYKANSQIEVIVGYKSTTFGDGEIRTLETLTRLKTTAYTYLLRTKPYGERVVLPDPASVWVSSRKASAIAPEYSHHVLFLLLQVLSNGVDPLTGDTVPSTPHAHVLANFPSRTFLPPW